MERYQGINPKRKIRRKAQDDERSRSNKRDFLSDAQWLRMALSAQELSAMENGLRIFLELETVGTLEKDSQPTSRQAANKPGSGHFSVGIDRR